MLSTTLPVRCAVAPQELLPIIPPSVQFMCVAGSGPNRRLVRLSCSSLSTSSTMPGSTMQVRAPASTSMTAVAVLGPVDDDRRVGALAGQAGAAAPGQHRRAVPAADRDRRHGRLDRARHDDADRDLAEVRGVGGVGGARARVEPDLAVHRRREVTLKLAVIHECASRSPHRPRSRRYPRRRCPCRLRPNGPSRHADPTAQVKPGFLVLAAGQGPFARLLAGEPRLGRAGCGPEKKAAGFRARAGRPDRGDPDQPARLLPCGELGRWFAGLLYWCRHLQPHPPGERRPRRPR